MLWVGTRKKKRRKISVFLSTVKGKSAVAGPYPFFVYLRSVNCTTVWSPSLLFRWD